MIIEYYDRTLKSYVKKHTRYVDSKRRLNEHYKPVSVLCFKDGRNHYYEVEMKDLLYIKNDRG